uniref:Phage protein n=1 Tax=Heterorhabditis bacteriophora TaxID=37862 RepID=A0A1I7X2D7_HETBA
MSGTTHEMTPIDPVLYIWHECKDEHKFQKFIHSGNPTAEQWIDIGVINLEGAFDDEGKECVN